MMVNFDFYLVFKKNKRGTTVSAFSRKPSTKPDEVSMRMKIGIPDEMFVKPTLECKIDLPPHRVNDISVNRKEIEDAVSKIVGTKIDITVNEVVL